MIDVPLILFLAKTILVENEESMNMCQVLQNNQCVVNSASKFANLFDTIFLCLSTPPR